LLYLFLNSTPIKAKPKIKKKFTKEQVIVIPADGPSFGTAASGTCTCISIFVKSKSFKFKFNKEEFDFIQEIAVEIDSRIISPIFPVSIKPPFPLKQVDSINVKAPPFKV